MIEGDFSERTLADMTIALERACQQLPKGEDGHEARKFIAQRIIQSARRGHTSLTELTATGKRAVVEMLSRAGNLMA
jgi:hypothetical protein